MKTWSAEARARFTKRMVDEAADQGDSEPFKTVGKRVGSNSQGIRNSYLALDMIEVARDDLGITTTYLQYGRFGVWIRSMNSVEIREYIGIGNPRTYADVKKCVREAHASRLAEVIGDLSMRSGDRRPLVGDSRDITAYGRILVDEAAHAALRKFEDFEVARQIVERKGFAAQIDTITSSISSILEELAKSGDAALAADLAAPVKRLNGLSRSLGAIVTELSRPTDD
jgi:hypothetical protein